MKDFLSNYPGFVTAFSVLAVFIIVGLIYYKTNIIERLLKVVEFFID